MPLPKPYPYHDIMTRLQEATALIETLKASAMAKQAHATIGVEAEGGLTTPDEQWEILTHSLVRVVMNLAYPNPTNPDGEQKS